MGVSLSLLQCRIVLQSVNLLLFTILYRTSIYLNRRLGLIFHLFTPLLAGLHCQQIWIIVVIAPITLLNWLLKKARKLKVIVGVLFVWDMGVDWSIHFDGVVTSAAMTRFYLAHRFEVFIYRIIFFIWFACLLTGPIKEWAARMLVVRALFIKREKVCWLIYCVVSATLSVNFLLNIS